MSEVAIDTDPVPDELCDGDVVIEVGAYEGAWVAKLCEQGNYDVYAFEPATRAYDMALKKLGDDPSVVLIRAALGKSSGARSLCDCMRDGANICGHNPEDEPDETVCVRDVAQFVRDLDENVALVHLNAEGSELDILDRLMDTGLIEQVKMILVQWHPYSTEDSAHISQVIQRLTETHQLENRGAWGFWQRKATEECQGHE